MSFGDDEEGIVCRVTAEGEVICEKVMQSSSVTAFRVADSKDALDGREYQKLREALPAGEWGPNKIRLAERLLELLALSDLPDDRIPRRSGEIVDSAKQLLAPVPPSILLYNYSTQPADVMGAFFLNRGELVRMQQMFKIFEHPKHP